MGDWIDTGALPRIEPGRTLVLFGAGNGSRELLRHFEEQETDVRVAAVLDNDPTMHGQTLHSIPVMAPEKAPDLGADLIVVTTVSGREAVSGQLRDMGFEPGRDFVCIGTFPRQASRDNLRVLANLDRAYTLAKGNVLHVGPGGYLGLECGLLALFGDRIVRMASVDAYEFNLAFPAAGTELPNYLHLRKEVLELAPELGVNPAEAAARWDRLFHEENGEPHLDRDRLELLLPHRFSALPFADASMDLVCSFAVLEHVSNPEKAVAEIRRVLKPGGFSVQAVTTMDHRAFGTVGDYTPISYRIHSEEEWERINKDKFPQNRVAPFQWKELFEAAGFTIEQYRIGSTYEPPPEEIARLHPDFRNWPPERQREVNCVIVATRQDR